MDKVDLVRRQQQKVEFQGIDEEYERNRRCECEQESSSANHPPKVVVSISFSLYVRWQHTCKYGLQKPISDVVVREKPLAAGHAAAIVPFSFAHSHGYIGYYGRLPKF